ncbi:MAG: ankyrin repeat domain-containing protein [Candidatus Babeliales bacterium]
MKKIVKKLLLTSLLFSAVIIPAKAHASFFNWATLSNGIAEIGNKTANLLITNSSKALNFLKNHPVVAGATALGIVFGLYKLRSKKNNRVKEKELEQAILKGEADVNQKDKDGTPRLIAAVYQNNIDLATLLIEHNADLDLRNRYGDTALMIAVEQENIDLVTLLIKHNANLNQQDIWGQTALGKAAKIGNKKEVELLIKNGANPDLEGLYKFDEPDVYKKSTAYDLGNDEIKNIIAAFKPQKLQKIPILEAIKNNRLEEVRQILLKGEADVVVNQQYGFNWETPLMRSVMRNNTEIVELLLKNGADPNLNDRYNQTALMIAVEWGNIDLVTLLIEHNANIGHQDCLGQTALMNATKYGNINSVALLIEHNANINHQDRWGQTALTEAAQKNNKKIVTLLLENGANPDVQTTDHKTAYDLGNKEIKNIIDVFKQQKSQEISI